VIDALNGNKNALLQSPTGTGKTLCLLCATLAWLQKQRAQSIEEMKDPSAIFQNTKIYYTSRTHSQLKQVNKFSCCFELNNTTR